jgi:hypothetical protein
MATTHTKTNTAPAKPNPEGVKIKTPVGAARPLQKKPRWNSFWAEAGTTGMALETLTEHPKAERA